MPIQNQKRKEKAFKNKKMQKDINGRKRQEVDLEMKNSILYCIVYNQSINVNLILNIINQSMLIDV